MEPTLSILNTRPEQRVVLWGGPPTSGVPLVLESVGRKEMMSCVWEGEHREDTQLPSMGTKAARPGASGSPACSPLLTQGSQKSRLGVLFSSLDGEQPDLCSVLPLPSTQ